MKLWGWLAAWSTLVAFVAGMALVAHETRKHGGIVCTIPNLYDIRCVRGK